MDEKIEVTERYLKQVLEIVEEMRNKGTYEDKWECEKVIKNTKHYLKNKVEEKKGDIPQCLWGVYHQER